MEQIPRNILLYICKYLKNTDILNIRISSKLLRKLLTYKNYKRLYKDKISHFSNFNFNLKVKNCIKAYCKLYYIYKKLVVVHIKRDKLAIEIFNDKLYKNYNISNILMANIYKPCSAFYGWNSGDICNNFDVLDKHIGHIICECGKKIYLEHTAKDGVKKYICV